MLSLEDVFPFGRHKDEQLEDVIGDNPSYFTWAIDNNIFDFGEDVIHVLEQKKLI